MTLRAILPEFGKSCVECSGPCPIKSAIVRDFERTKHGHHRQVAPGCEIYYQGDPARDFFVLLDGWVCLYVLLADGRRQNVKLAVPGDLLAFSPQRDQELDHSAVALTNAVLCPIDRGRFARHAVENPQLLANVNDYLVREQALMCEQLTSLARRSATERIAHIFYELFVRTQERPPCDGDSMIMPLTQEQIGDATGLSAVHVCRMLNAMRSAGILTFADRVLSIHDAARFAELAGLDGELLLAHHDKAAVA